MKMIMSALAASMLLAGIAVPASAEAEVSEIIREYVIKSPSGEASRYVKLRKLPRQPEYIADEMEVGSKEWWQQMDRERRGGRR